MLTYYRRGYLWGLTQDRKAFNAYFTPGSVAHMLGSRGYRDGRAAGVVRGLGPARRRPKRKYSGRQ